MRDADGRAVSIARASSGGVTIAAPSALLLLAGAGAEATWSVTAAPAAFTLTAWVKLDLDTDLDTETETGTETVAEVRVENAAGQALAAAAVGWDAQAHLRVAWQTRDSSGTEGEASVTAQPSRCKVQQPNLVGAKGNIPTRPVQRATAQPGRYKG